MASPFEFSMSDKTQLPTEGIRRLRVTEDPNGDVRQLSCVFGPHHFLDLRIDQDGKIKFAIGCTHHGFEADASELDSELEQIINEVRENHRDKIIEDMPGPISPKTP